ncbi:MAG: pectinesterase family protein, partial [Rikenellaceae bacterium]|nr:pectinesterase family protein [Rikenellaceae bacterium]
LLDGNVARIYPHHHRLEYGRSYYVLIDSGVFTLPDGGEFEIQDKKQWTFTVKAEGPAADASRIVVSADGTADFTTVQGAIDFLPKGQPAPVTIFIRNGIYEEIINCVNRHQLKIIGEDREKVIIRYPNNGVFNTKIVSPDPLQNKGCHNMRAVMAVYDSSEMMVADLTLHCMGEAPAQAEALLIKGDKMIVDNVSMEGSRDALQANGRIYVRNSKIQGFGDNVLGDGAVFSQDCDFVSTYGPHLWVRNTDKNHGNVLVNCTLRTIGDVQTHIARAPDNHGIQYPYCEAVLIDCKLDGIRPEGWGRVTENPVHVRYWEYNSTDLHTGQPVDVSQRHPASRQLTMENDAQLIASYRDPAYVLEGWTPVVER